MAPIHQTREERAPASEQPRPLLHVLIRLRSLRDIAAAVDGLSLHHKSDWFHFVTEQNIYRSKRSSPDWRVYLSPNKDAARCFAEQPVFQALPPVKTFCGQDGELNSTGSKGCHLCNSILLMVAVRAEGTPNITGLKGIRPTDGHKGSTIIKSGISA